MPNDSISHSFWFAPECSSPLFLDMQRMVMTAPQGIRCLGNSPRTQSPPLLRSPSVACSLSAFHSGPAQAHCMAVGLCLPSCLSETVPSDPSEGICMSRALQRHKWEARMHHRECEERHDWRLGTACPSTDSQRPKERTKRTEEACAVCTISASPN